MLRNRNKRADRIPSKEDKRAGAEGIEDPAMSEVERDDMTETPMQGDELEEGRSMESEPSQREQSQRSMRTNQLSNDESWDDASEFSGRGGQKEGMRESESMPEGTGYTEDRNNA
jgi:hypothetical protein